MKERELSFNANGDTTIIEMDKQNKDKALKDILNMQFVLQEFSAKIKGDKLETGYCQTLCSLSENYLIEMLKQFDYESVVAEKKKKNIEMVKNVNIENRELRKQLGEKASPEDVRECLKNMESKVRDWWNKEGLGHISEFRFNPYNLQIKLSGSLSMRSDKEQVEKLQKIGYELVEESGGGYSNLANTESNIALLISEVQRRFPSAMPWNIDVNYNMNRNKASINTMEFVIRDYDDMFQEVI